MRQRTKNLILLQLFGLAAVLAILALRFRGGETCASAGWTTDVLITAAAAGAVHLFFCYWPLRALTGLRLGMLAGLGGKKEGGEKRESVRHFSWLLLLTTPAAMAGPAWIFLKEGAAFALAAGVGAFAATCVVLLFIPSVDGKYAINKFRALSESGKKTTS